MIETFQFKQSGDLDPALSDPATRKLSADKLIGRWVNTDPNTRGIAAIVIEQDDEQFSIGVKGVGADGLIDWPRTRATALATGQRVRGALRESPDQAGRSGLARAARAGGAGHRHGAPPAAPRGGRP